jgi:hypothetical protein
MISRPSFKCSRNVKMTKARNLLLATDSDEIILNSKMRSLYGIEFGLGRLNELRIFNNTLNNFRKERKIRDRPVTRQFILIRVRLSKKRMYRTRFEMIMENTKSKRKINDSS